MDVYLFTAGASPGDLNDLEARLRSKLPHLQRLAKINEVTNRLAEAGTTKDGDQIYIIFPILTAQISFDRILNIAEQGHRGVFLIFITRDISAGDYKRLIKGGNADWASLAGAPEEILDIISRTAGGKVPSAATQGPRTAITSFVPSGGGVGNTTLVIESAVQAKGDKSTRSRRICLLDLDLQTSHVCDYLDIAPRLQVEEITHAPERLDTQLFEVYVSHHPSSGIDVLAAPRNRSTPAQLSIAALEVLFQRISENYDLLLVDLPLGWFEWTNQIISVCDLAVVTGLNTVPSLRQVAETLKMVRAAGRIPPEIIVALNRCETRSLFGIAGRQYAKRVLGQETIHYIRQDAAAANHSLNTGVPITMASHSSRIAKDVRALATTIAKLKPTER